MEFGFGLVRVVDERDTDATEPAEMVCNHCGKVLAQFPSPTPAELKALIERVGLGHQCAKDLEDRLLRIWGPMPPNQMAEITRLLEQMMEQSGRTPEQVVNDLLLRQLDYLGDQVWYRGGRIGSAV